MHVESGGVCLGGPRIIAHTQCQWQSTSRCVVPTRAKSTAPRNQTCTSWAARSMVTRHVIAVTRHTIAVTRHTIAVKAAVCTMPGMHHAHPHAHAHPHSPRAIHDELCTLTEQYDLWPNHTPCAMYQAQRMASLPIATTPALANHALTLTEQHDLRPSLP